MSFLSPTRLWLLVLVAAIVGCYAWQASRRSRYAVRFTDLALLASVAPSRPGWRRHVPAGLLALSLVALVVGFARPQAEVSVPREQATVVVALDVSLSMEAVDVSPSRISSAQQAATAFIEGLPDRYNVGLVAFSGTAAVAVAPTQDHAAVTRAVQDLTLDAGTAIGDAVFASLNALKLVPAQDGTATPPARIVLLSDGTNTVGRSVESAVTAANDAKVPVSTIAFGTQTGTVVVEGQRIAVPVDRPALRSLADSTNGTAYTAESSSDLSEAYEDIGSSVGTTREKREVTDRLTGLGLLLAAAAAGLGLLWGTRIP
ncbi:MAG TPA: VWA domain-containing protein [Mycobacteriales bacterium]|jgi:Ca-activated chloride channel family protein|nr:VWA domain-containing protein [Mycobacteriales bacterium]